MIAAAQLLPVYLVLPSHPAGHSGAQFTAMIPAFVDTLAQHPVIAERVLLGIAEYSSFLNELCPLGTPLEVAAAARTSGFRGTSYQALFDALATLLEYDHHRLAGDGIRIGSPLISLIVDERSAAEDEWADTHRALIGSPSDATAPRPIVTVVSTRPPALETAEAVVFPGRRCAVASDPVEMGKLAASAVIEVCLHGVDGTTPAPRTVPAPGRSAPPPGARSVGNR